MQCAVRRERLYPRWQLSGAGTRTDSRITGNTFNSESYKASFNTSLQVDLFGKQYQNLKAAGADLEKISENY